VKDQLHQPEDIFHEKKDTSILRNLVIENEISHIRLKKLHDLIAHIHISSIIVIKLINWCGI